MAYLLRPKQALQFMYDGQDASNWKVASEMTFQHDEIEKNDSKIFLSSYAYFNKASLIVNKTELN